MQLPPPAVFHDKAKRTQQGNLLFQLTPILDQEIQNQLDSRQRQGGQHRRQGEYDDLCSFAQVAKKDTAWPGAHILYTLLVTRAQPLEPIINEANFVVTFRYA